MQNTTGPGGGARVAPVSLIGSSVCSATTSIFNPLAPRRSIRSGRLICRARIQRGQHLTKAHFEALKKAIAVQEEPSARHI